MRLMPIFPGGFNGAYGWQALILQVLINRWINVVKHLSLRMKFRFMWKKDEASGHLPGG